MQKLTIRKALLEDLPTITTIYNQAIEAGQTADTIPYKEMERQPWFEAHQNPKYPLYVAIEEETVVGYATLSEYRGGRPAVQFAVEISYYIHQKHQRKGLGTLLLQHSIKTAQQLGFKHGLALLLDINLPSIRLLEKHGFVKWGHFPNIAIVKEQICGQYFYGRHFEEEERE